MRKPKLVYVVWALLVIASVAIALASVSAGDAGGGGGHNIILPFLFL